MKKLGILSLIAAAALAVATFTTRADADDAACKRKDFKTELVKQACTGPKGSQEAAKDAMKKFMKDKGIKSCNECHSKLAPDYPLKDTGLKEFTDKGGK